MKRLFLLATLSPTVAVAHTGHLADAAGHDHWVAGIAVGAAIATSAWAILKDRRRKAEAEAAGDDTDEAEA